MGFPGGPVVGDPLANAEDTGLIRGLGTKISHAAEQLTHVPLLLSLHSSACEQPRDRTQVSRTAGEFFTS